MCVNYLGRSPTQSKCAGAVHRCQDNKASGLKTQVPRGVTTQACPQMGFSWMTGVSFILMGQHLVGWMGRVTRKIEA